MAEHPRIAPHAYAMRTNVAETLGLPLEAVSVKATTNEGLGSIGRGEGLAALALVQIELISD